MKIDIGGCDRRMPCFPNLNANEYLIVDVRNTADFVAPMENLPFSDSEIEAIHSSHCLEHTPMHRVIPTLREWRRVLKPGGRLDLVVPSLEYCVRQWLDASEEDRWDFKYYCIFARNEYPGDTHYTGFTLPRLRYYLTEAEFDIQSIGEAWYACHEQNEIRALCR